MHSPSIPTRCVHPAPERGPQDPERAYARRAVDAMGCRFEVLIDVDRSPHDAWSCGAIGDEMVELILDWHQRLTVFEPGSIVSGINRQPVGMPLAIDPDLFGLCQLCDSLRIETRGAFNIASGTLMHAHGFRGGGATTTPDGIDLDRAFTLDTESSTITRHHARASLDFGAVAKGFVLDLIEAELRSHGISHAFIHGGTSSSLAMGTDSTARPWGVRISEGPCCDVRLSDMALGVSEIGSRTVENGGITRGHVMDPRTGGPASSSVARVACAHRSAAVADAYSTALNVDPSLVEHLCDAACSVVLYTLESPRPMIYDGLGVVQYAA